MQHDYHQAGRIWPTRSAISLALMAALSFSSSAHAAGPTNLASSEDTEFDMQAMQARGIDPKLAEWFRQAPRFMPGELTVSLKVNGNARGRVKTRFGDNGQICVDKDFLKQAGLATPSGFSESATCFDLKNAWPQTELNLDPGQEHVDLVVPPQAVADSKASSNWNHGGFAGMLNYDAQYMDSSGSSAGVTFMQLSTEAGFNVSDWIIRSRQTFSRFNSEDSMQHQAAYAQRSFTDAKKVFQAGQISLSNSMFGTGQVLGMQLFPESALQNSGGAGLVDGVADSQSVVEVRQSGALIYSTTVPTGPFRLQGFSLLNTRTDLDVTITNSNGTKRQFVVPASSFMQRGARVSPGLSLGAGKLEQQGSSEAPIVFTAATGWLLGSYTTLNAGLLGSTPYRAGAFGLDSQLFDATMLSIQTTVAQDDKHNDNGVSVSASLSHQLTERIGLNVNASQQTSGYRELSDALQDEQQDRQGQNRNQYGGGVSWSGTQIGSLSLSWARSSTFNGDSSRFLRGSWSKQFGQTYVGASLEHDSGSSTTDAENRFYVTLNVPFGGSRNISTYFNTASTSRRSGVRYSDRSSQDRGWSLSSERDFRNNRTSGNGSIDMVTPISQLSGNVSHDSNHYTSWSGRASGGIVAHSAGITLSPYHINDTFGIAKVGDQAGIRLDTPSGPTWTDSRGYAVLPSLSSYKNSAIQVDTRSLPKNVDIGNAWQETEAARGSVNYVNFDVLHTRRVLATVKDVLGKMLPHGASVFDALGNFVTVVGNNGSVFIPDASTVGKMDVQASGKTICSFKLALPEQVDTSGLYEAADAVCR